MLSKLIKVIFVLLLVSNSLFAEDIVLCTQNLYNYGKAPKNYFQKKYKPLSFEKKTKKLVERFYKSKCDVIAVQELLANNETEALKLLNSLGDSLSKKTKKSFDSVTGKSRNRPLMMGYLFNQDRLKVLSTHSYYKTVLPRFSKHERNSYFSRGPLRLDLKTDSGQTLSLFNIHFKSASTKSGYDPAGYRFEIDRMQMSQALAEIIESVRSDIVVILGDRNSVPESASADILEGEIELNYFSQALCSLSDLGKAICPKTAFHKARFVSLVNNDPDILSLISLRGQKYKLKLIDDILINTQKEIYALKSRPSDYNSGIIFPEKDVTDHPLLWAKLKF